MGDKNGEQEFVVKKATLTSIYDEIREIRETDIPELIKTHAKFCGELDKVKNIPDRVAVLEDSCKQQLSNIPDRVAALEDNCKQQLSKFEQDKLITETEVEVLNRIEKERKDAKDEEHNKTIRFLKIIAVIISIITFAGYFIW